MIGKLKAYVIGVTVVVLNEIAERQPLLTILIVGTVLYLALLARHVFNALFPKRDGTEPEP